MKKRYIFVDTETTGLVGPAGTALFNQPHMIEFSAIITNNKFKTIDEYTTLIKPPIPIPPFITKITSISDLTVANAPPIHKVFGKIIKIFKKANVMVAQNLRFDKSIIEFEAQRTKQRIKFPKILFCTVEQSMHISGFRMNSKELLAYSEKRSKATEFKNIHRARADVIAMIKYCRDIMNNELPKHLIIKNGDIKNVVKY